MLKMKLMLSQLSTKLELKLKLKLSLAIVKKITLVPLKNLKNIEIFQYYSDNKITLDMQGVRLT